MPLKTIEECTYLLTRMEMMECEYSDCGWEWVMIEGR